MLIKGEGIFVFVISFQQYTVRLLIERGAPVDKLILGVPAFSRTFELLDASQHTFGSPASNIGIQGPYTKENGMMGYNEVSVFRCICVVFQCND